MLSQLMGKFVVKKSLLLVTTDDLIASVMHFRCTNSVSGKRRATVYNEVQKAASSLSRIGSHGKHQNKETLKN